MIMTSSTDIFLIMLAHMCCPDYHVTQPLQGGEENTVFQVSHLDKLPVCAKDIATETRRNPLLSKVLDLFVWMAQSCH